MLNRALLLNLYRKAGNGANKYLELYAHRNTSPSFTYLYLSGATIEEVNKAISEGKKVLVDISPIGSFGYMEIENINGELSIAAGSSLYRKYKSTTSTGLLYFA